MADNKYDMVLSELFKMCIDEENKASDRVSAAKLLLEYLKEGQTNENGDIRIIFDGIEKELTE